MTRDGASKGENFHFSLSSTQTNLLSIFSQVQQMWNLPDFQERSTRSYPIPWLTLAAVCVCEQHLQEQALALPARYSMTAAMYTGAPTPIRYL